MWVAFLIVALHTGDVQAQMAPQPFTSEEECKAVQAKVEAQVKESDQVASYVLKCVEVKPEDVKKAGKDA